MIMRSGARQVLPGGAAVPNMFYDPYSDVDPAPLTDPRTLEVGYAVITNAAQMSTDGDLLNALEASAGSGGLAYSKNDGAATTLADGMLFAAAWKDIAGSTALGTGMHSSSVAPGSYASFNGFACNFAVTFKQGSDFYNFASAVFGANVTVAFWFDGSLMYIYTYNYNDVSPRWELKLIVPAISGDYYFTVQTLVNQASGTNELSQVGAGEALTGIVGGVSCGTSEGSTADAPSAEYVGHMVLTTLPSADSVIFEVSRQDDSNYLDVEVNSAGDMIINETVGGTRTPQVSASGKAANGEHMVVTRKGNNLDFWVKADRIRHTTSNFSAEVGCKLSSLGTGGVVSDILLHELAPSGAIASNLNSVGGV